jgi:hypothetical protein
MKTLAFQMSDEQLRDGMERTFEIIDRPNDLSESAKGVLAEVAIDYEEELTRRLSLNASVVPAWAHWMLVPMI